MPRTLLAAFFVLSAVCLTPTAPVGAADPPQLKTLDDHFPFTPPDSLEAWRSRAEEVRQQLRVACGVWPMPNLASSEPWIGEPIVFPATDDSAGYSVSPITIESLPGLHVTGSLYRPHPDRAEPGPGILSPHGHWPDGRFHDAGLAAARREIAAGGERFIAAARSPMQARCVQLARMGCTVLLYDMLGYADSTQISFDRAHRFANQSDAENRPDADGWLLFSPLAESHLQSPMALQTIHTLAALNALAELPSVDKQRIAITGASGGGTQSFIAAAIEPRIAAAFPAVMVSTGMQGGCTCENACLLRVATGNIEIAAAIAPRPLGMTAADDWTRTMPVDGFPELQQLYQLWGAADAVQLYPALHFGHNYNHVSRTAMYGFINRVFNLGHEEPVLESDFRRLDRDALSVWNDSHPEPSGGLKFERQLLRQWADQTQQKIEAAVPAGEDASAFSQLVAAGWRTILGSRPSNVSLDAASVAESEEPAAKRFRGSGRIRFDESGLVSLDGLRPAEVTRGILLVAHPRGPQLLQSASPASADSRGIAEALEAGWAVVVADLEGLGEETQPLVREDRLAAAFTYGYNSPRAVRQARQLVAAAEGLRQLAAERGYSGLPQEGGAPIRLVGFGSLAPAAALARAMAPEQFAGTVVATDGFRFADVGSVDDAQFVPGAARYLDIPGLLAMPSHGSLTVLGETPESLAITARVAAANKGSAPLESRLRILADSDPPLLWQQAIAQDAQP